MNFKELASLLVLLNRCKSIVCVLLLLLILAISNEVIIYNIGLITGNYYQILNEKNYDAFVQQTIKSLLLIVGIALLKSLKDYTASFLYVKWRQKLTSDLQEHYFVHMAYYRLNVLLSQESSNKVMSTSSDDSNHFMNDNIDQRITQDVDKMTNRLSVLIPEVIVSPFIIVFYSYKCYMVTGFIGPLACLVFIVLSNVINKWLIQQVAHYVYAQERCEGDFRFQHLRVRNLAESIAFYSGESIEKHKCDQFLSALLTTQDALILRQLLLKFSINLFDYIGSILSFIALAIPLFAGMYNDLSGPELTKLISQNAFVTIYLINCFTRLIDLAVDFSVFLGTSMRIADLYKWFQHNEQEINQSLHAINSGEMYENIHQMNSSADEDDVYFDCSKICITTPSENFVQQRILVKDLNLQIKPSQNMIITGPSGVGKSSLFRAFKNIWPLADGCIRRNLLLDNPNLIMFIPSKAVFTNGSVAEQILYPKVYKQEVYQLNEIFRERVIEILKFLELEHSVLERVQYDIFAEFQINWIDHLSAGEVQRLSLARVLYHQPRLVLLDEATTALPEKMEHKILTQLIANSTTLVSCGHREHLKQFHQFELQFFDQGNYRLLQIN